MFSIDLDVFFTQDNGILEANEQCIITELALHRIFTMARYWDRGQISRYPEPVPELREKAREEVESARKSNRTIVFGLGHHSVADEPDAEGDEHDADDRDDCQHDEDELGCD